MRRASPPARTPSPPPTLRRPPRHDHPRDDHPRHDHPRDDHPRDDHPRHDHRRRHRRRGDGPATTTAAHPGRGAAAAAVGSGTGADPEQAAGGIPAEAGDQPSAPATRLGAAEPGPARRGADSSTAPTAATTASAADTTRTAGATGQLAPTPATPAAPVAAPAAATATAQPAPVWTPPSPHEQVLAAATPLLRGADGSYDIQLQLHPKDLGVVHLAVTVHHGEVSIQMNAPDAGARDALRSGLSDLRQQLEDQGLSAGSMEVGSGGAEPRQPETPWQRLGSLSRPAGSDPEPLPSTSPGPGIRSGLDLRM